MVGNRIKTVVLLGTLSSLLLLLGNLFGGAHGMQFALIIALLFNGIAYFFSDKIVLAMYSAQPLDRNQYNWIYRIIEELRMNMNLPMPKLWLVKTPVANAFATGRNPAHASIALTTGILDILDYNELRGVLAHEMSHIKNRDILVSTVAATLATAISYLANMMQHMAFWGSMRSSDDRKRGNPLVMFIVALIMPLAAMLIQFAISRSREYLADETGARACHDPLALASALEKLNNNAKHTHFNNQETAKASTASLFIVNPFGSINWANLFSTHPPMQRRIERLHALCHKRY